MSYARRADRVRNPEELRIISSVADGDNRDSEDLIDRLTAQFAGVFKGRDPLESRTEDALIDAGVSSPRDHRRNGIAPGSVA